MLGIYENLPEDVLQEIWFETHKGNSIMIKKTVNEKKSILDVYRSLGFGYLYS
jgi:hypothetical protein